MYSSSQSKIRNPSWDAMKKISTWDVVDKAMFRAFSQTIVIVLYITSKRQQNDVCFTTDFSWIDSEKNPNSSCKMPPFADGKISLFIRTCIFLQKKPLFAIWKGGPGEAKKNGAEGCSNKKTMLFSASLMTSQCTFNWSWMMDREPFAGLKTLGDFFTKPKFDNHSHKSAPPRWSLGLIILLHTYW